MAGTCTCSMPIPIRTVPRTVTAWRCSQCGRVLPVPDPRDAEIARLREEVEMLTRHPRAAKLMRENRAFFVVAADEPYAKCVAALIKNVEDGMGKWTTDDETRVAAMLHVDVVDKTPPNAHTRLRRAEVDLAAHRRALAAGPAALRASSWPMAEDVAGIVEAAQEAAMKEGT